ncbi:MAG: hypothetical protein A3G52_01765 [Candidatus Taylorbacteria bacterium RIFCSPLOWO2_12_FULL_43_20]|uniref:Uncharacterized protein n=1 Tax=Candidatus Taylorbacteria bacterium RIFCSPLOWO2_12_FULL_43_20 TaxID=1802332 RepID=A0A1G2P305_9BACT|nr:MAG: hypothetical protein A3B98_00250 [Candidatus Taylorbacteria bacterium RIFCSPHIGHO2_02_FULL_43_55]OHA29930.1 MAG: hypothetical protein A3E92_03880 [Candidatus Taylorbacteria bacterium RIFCSPHIGHO2_12_FULL_42_34]OHA30562.1 MAG: hypothetical protein A3B09_01500 [Candidatus Taylorbacteria bacterium RIFCSPLOWO2_01_FULL_43_83]OHA38394.1 MAG: hypothetical protein A3H58_04305 [Candidatus Taylorbacteria bacterium RIFCSPLOWO2_02_FULL_43_22b]OHA42002.1 MAG: hypothetical protein A3G52_01765 [Candid
MKVINGTLVSLHSDPLFIERDVDQGQPAVLPRWTEKTLDVLVCATSVESSDSDLAYPDFGRFTS